jgi:hypothetical protein
MKKSIIFIAVFIYADISNILFKIEKIESYKPVFKKIYLKRCRKIKKPVRVYSVNKNVQLHLMAIFNDKVLINNTWVKKGDFIEGYKIIKIYPKKVILRKNNKFIVLKFNNNFLRIKK